MVGERIKMLRLERNLTMKDMANKFGITISAWNKYEKNESEPNITNIIKMADFFGTSTDFLLCKTNIRDNLIIEKSKDLDEMLKKYENINSGDTSNMYFITENLLVSLENCETELITESQLQLLLKAIEEVILHFNTLTELRNNSQKLNKTVLDEHRSSSIKLLEIYNDILTSLFQDSIK